MGQIVVLDQNMINVIAAGEVIERPASVAKELLENSIDAGATKIILSIEDGGRKSICVTDNGCGMDAEDLERAFQAHATSKIKTSADLLNISTLGFRGEALASIGSIAMVKAVSRTKDSPAAHQIENDCGNKSDVNPCSADYGTTVEVRDIFYKTPARRKFLKTANTEAGHINEHFTRIALANTNLDMTLINNGRETYRLLPDQGLRQRIGQLFSNEIAENLLETRFNEKGLEISALLGVPEISRTNNKFQYVFLNSRFIRDKFISHAIREGYRPAIEHNRFPVVFLFIKMAPDQFDVNVHPTKIEVRFYNSNLVHSQILSCLRQKLQATNLAAQAKIPAEQTGRQEIKDAMADFFNRHPSSQSQPKFGFRSGAAKSSGSFHDQPQQISVTDTAVYEQFEHKFLQIHDSFIITQTDEGFVIVDQHALHERILYEDLKRRISAGKLQSQKLLIPESFQLDQSQAETIKANAELFEKLGIELAPFGPQTYAIHAFPTLLSKAEPIDFVRDLIDLLQNNQTDFDADKLLDDVLNMAACKAAIKAGHKLTNSEIEELLSGRETDQYLNHCPHGRPTAIKFSKAQLEKQFKRT